MTFATGAGLWLLAALPVVWLLAWHGHGARSTRRLIGATVLRSLALVLIALALARPALLERSREVSVVYAIDVSNSVSRPFVQQTLDWIGAENAKHHPAQTRYVVFADRAKLLDSAEEVLSVELAAESGTHGAALDQSATDLEQAVRTALFGFPASPARRLVLISDGNQTRGDVWRMLPRLQAERVRVFSIPAVVAVASDAWVEAVSIPQGVRQQEPVLANVRIFSRTPAAARVELTSGERTLGIRSLTLRAGDNDVAFRIRMPRAGSHAVTAHVQAEGDEVARNDILSEHVQVASQPRVLYIEGVAQTEHYLADALRAHNIEVTLAESGALTSEKLSGQDAVIVSDVPAQSIDAAASHALETFVRDQGGGLIFAAGESTYGKQGYAQSELERLLPVQLQGKRKRRELDLILLIDRSHSMRGRKLELAKTAALATLDLLEEQHRLAVVAFDSRPHEVVPLAEVGSKRRAEDLIASMAASGQTNIYRALVEAQRLLTSSTASTKHIILLSDGVTSPPGGNPRSNSEETQERVRQARAETIRQAGGQVPEPIPDLPAPLGGMEDVVAELARMNVTLSTVAIGEKPNRELMKHLADSGSGKSYIAAHDAEIPGLFVSETRRLLGEAIVEESFRPAVFNRTNAIAGLDFQAGPPLKGFVVARPKQFSDVLLKAVKDQPLLVQTHYGLGKTVAFLSDVKNRWAAQWLGWDGYGRFWAQVVRDTIPRNTAEGLSWRVSRERNEARIEIIALDAQRMYRNGLMPKVRITPPAGDASVLALRQVGAGRYRGSLPLTAGSSAPYRFEILEGGGLTRRETAQLGTRTLSYPWSDEYRLLPPNNPLLRALSEQTGGAFAPKAEDIFALRGDGAVTPKPLWPWFAAAALVLFLLDILIRRAPRM